MLQHSVVNASQILNFWFGPLTADGMPLEDRNSVWFNGGEAVDAEIRQRFGADVERALAGDLDDWRLEANGLVALMLLLDQFTRNIYRGVPAAFSGDEKALALARTAIEENQDLALPTIYRVFLYNPFQHAESLADQTKGVELVQTLLAQCGDASRDYVANSLRYFQAHLDVIEKFGRFPHRNAVLGRASTPEERAFMETHSGF
ncbi:MAG: DUF924 family protein [Pseudomonadota bacterium]